MVGVPLCYSGARCVSALSPTAPSALRPGCLLALSPGPLPAVRAGPIPHAPRRGGAMA